MQVLYLTIWKLVKGAVLIVLLVGLLNFVLTPGGFEEKMAGAYVKTSCQIGEVARIGRTVFVDESDNMVQVVGSGVWKLRQEEDRSIRMSIGPSGD